MTLFVTVGLPGSGKTTWRKQQEKNGVFWTVVCPDEIRANMMGVDPDVVKPFDPDREVEVWEEVERQVIGMLLMGGDVLLDVTALDPFRRAGYKWWADETKHNTVFLVFPFNPALSWRRRSGQIPYEAWERMREMYVEPTPEEGGIIVWV